MDLTDLKFLIKDAGITEAYGTITISEVSGILSGVIHNAILPEDCKTILTVTAIDGQSTDIEVNWEAVAPTLEVRGFEDEYSVLNGTYIVTYVMSDVRIVGEHNIYDENNNLIDRKSINIGFIEDENKTRIEFAYYEDIDPAGVPFNVIAATLFLDGNQLNNTSWSGKVELWQHEPCNVTVTLIK